ncbi:MAG: bifunctional riboflavin kinase/FAD synthetase [Deltaproteobacteria bacterium]|nr:bifunctional riboflavin kinase/FAD synthetase [Deltaproteobacteria bacterium]
MKVHFGSQNIKVNVRHCVLTIGNFDGVHLGHKKIFELVRFHAAAEQTDSVALTFYPHPSVVLKKSSENIDINTLEEKIALIEREKINHLVIEPFTKEFSQLKPDVFFNDILNKRFYPKIFIIGHDFSFGKNREGNIETLKTLCHPDQKVIVVPKFEYNGFGVSSSEIRSRLKEGDVETAHKLLGHTFFVSGKVVPGSQRGKKLKCATANLSFGERLLPQDGVYIMFTEYRKKLYPSVGSLGHNETYGEGLPKTLEVHLLDFHQNLYKKPLIVHFLKRIRDMKKFQSEEELKRAITHDIEQVRKYFEK